MQTNNKQQTIQNNPNNANNKQTQKKNINRTNNQSKSKPKAKKKQTKNKPKLNNNNEKQQQQKETTKISGHTRGHRRGQSGATYALTQIRTHRHNTNVVRK